MPLDVDHAITSVYSGGLLRANLPPEDRRVADRELMPLRAPSQTLSPCRRRERKARSSSRACSWRSTTSAARRAARAYAARGSSSAAPASSARNVSDSSSCRRAPLGELELREDRARLGRPAVLARPATAPRATRAAPRSPRARRRRAGRRAAARPCRSSGSPAGGTRRRSGPAAAGGRAAAPRPNAIAEPASRPRWRTRKRRCLPSPTSPGCDRLAAGDEQRHVRVAEAERREPRRAPREVERQRGAGDDRVDPRHGREVVVGEHRVGVRGERGGEGLELVRARSRARRRRGGRRSARGARSTRRARRAGRTPAASGPSPSSSPSVPAISTTGRLKRSTSREATIPITPSCQSSPPST